MKVGAAAVEITPPVGLAMDGFGSRTGGAAGVHDPLFARALVAEGDDGTAVAIAVADLLDVGQRLQERIAARLARSTGMVRDHLQLVGTHTHSGPAFLVASEEEAAVADGIAEAVERAWISRREGRLAVGMGEVHGIGANRRPHGGPVDDRVTVVRVDDLAGGPIATLVNYGCHPTTLGPNNLLYSADYPGVVCREVEASVGGVALFTTGPQGDVNPGGYSPEDSMIGIVVPWRTFESAERYGSAIAACAIETRAGLHPAGVDGVWGRSTILRLRRKALPDAAAARRAAVSASAAVDALQATGSTVDAINHAAIAAAYADLEASQSADPERDGPVATRISAIGLGEFVHAGVQGELFVALGQRIRAGIGDDRSCVAALCDGSIGYIPTAAAFAEGAYEPNASVLVAGEGERLADELIALATAAGVGSGPSRNATT